MGNYIGTVKCKKSNFWFCFFVFKRWEVYVHCNLVLNVVFAFIFCSCIFRCRRQLHFGAKYSHLVDSWGRSVSFSCLRHKLLLMLLRWMGFSFNICFVFSLTFHAISSWLAWSRLNLINAVAISVSWTLAIGLF